MAFTGGGLTPILTSSSTKGMHQTHVAARTAPPARRRVGGPFIGAIVVSPILAAIVSFAVAFGCSMVGLATETGTAIAEGVFWVGIVVLSIGFLALAVTGHKFNQGALPSLHRDWTRKWLCHRCGADFAEGEGNAQAILQPRPGTGKTSHGEPSIEESAMFRTRAVKPIPALLGVIGFGALLFGGMAVVSPSRSGSEEVAPATRVPARSSSVIERPATKVPRTELLENYQSTWPIFPNSTIDSVTDDLVKAFVGWRGGAKTVTFTLTPLGGSPQGTCTLPTDAVRATIRAEVARILGE